MDMTIPIRRTPEPAIKRYQMSEMQEKVYRLIWNAGPAGITTLEMRQYLPEKEWGGPTTGAASKLHEWYAVTRLTEKRGGYGPYVLARHLGDRDFHPHKQHPEGSTPFGPR